MNWNAPHISDSKVKEFLREHGPTEEEELEQALKEEAVLVRGTFGSLRSLLQCRKGFSVVQEDQLSFIYYEYDDGAGEPPRGTLSIPTTSANKVH